MKNLIRFELRKILLNRLAIISLAAVFLLSLGLSFLHFKVCTHLMAKVLRAPGEQLLRLTKKLHRSMRAF